jgi:hypothetical protein
MPRPPAPPRPVGAHEELERDSLLADRNSRAHDGHDPDRRRARAVFPYARDSRRSMSSSRSSGRNRPRRAYRGPSGMSHPAPESAAFSETSTRCGTNLPRSGSRVRVSFPAPLLPLVAPTTCARSAADRSAGLGQILGQTPVCPSDRARADDPSPCVCPNRWVHFMDYDGELLCCPSTCAERRHG